MRRKPPEGEPDINGARMPKPALADLPLFAQETREYVAEAEQRLNATLAPVEEFVRRGQAIQRDIDNILGKVKRGEPLPDTPTVERLRRGSAVVHPPSDPAGIEAGRSAREAHAAARRAKVAALVPLARRLAAARPAGITVSDLRLFALAEGLLTGAEKGRELSYLGVVMREAGLESTGEWRRSDIAKAHGIPNLIWRQAR